MRKIYLLLTPFLFLVGISSASAVTIKNQSLGLIPANPNFATLGLEYSKSGDNISLRSGVSTLAQLTEFGGKKTDYASGLFSYNFSGDVTNLSDIDFSASTVDDKVNLTGTVVAFSESDLGSGMHLEFLVDVVSTGTVDFGSKLGISVSNISGGSADANNFVVPVPTAVWFFSTGLLGLAACRTKHTI